MHTSRSLGPSRRRARASAPVVLGALLAIVASGPAAVAGGGGAGGRNATEGDRTGTRALDARRIDSPSTGSPTRSASIVDHATTPRLRASLGGQGIVELDPLTTTPRMVAKLDGYLTGPSSADAATIALRYVRANAPALGIDEDVLASLTLVRRYVDVAGIRHLWWEQRVGGRAVFGNDLQAAVAADGRLIQVTGAPLSDLRQPAPARLSARQALDAVGADAAVAAVAVAEALPTREVVFATAAGNRAAFRTITTTNGALAVRVIDARSGAVLFRQSLTEQANGNVIDNYPGADAGGTQAPVDFTAAGWLAPGAPTLTGNNAHAFADVNDDDVAQTTEEVAKVGDDFLFPLVINNAVSPLCSIAYPCTWNPNVARSWSTNLAATTTNLFALVNRFHDHLLADPIGFTEAAGNFQVTNGTGDGKGGDPVIAQSLDGAAKARGLPDAAHIDNANMGTPPDGASPIMQMYLFHQPRTTPAVDGFLPASGSDEADVVYHEYTHGLSNRLVVDAAGLSTLGDGQAGSMGEAWSDWYAFDALVAQGLQADTNAPGEVLVGRYVSAGGNLIRTQALDCPVGSASPRCPGTSGAGSGGYTYGDYGRILGFHEVHADGEIWGETLWDLRDALGSTATEALVTRAMELSPANPSMLDERNAIVQADTVLFGGAHHDDIWATFAHRGMGWFAGSITADDRSVVEDFHVPPGPGAPTGELSGVVTDAATGAPIAGALVGVAGHTSALGGSLRDTTDGAGHYRIADVPVGTYPVFVNASGYDQSYVEQEIVAGTTTTDVALIRDWAAKGGGATISKFNGPDFTADGCGPGNAIDQSVTSGWSSATKVTKGKIAARFIVVALPRAVDVSDVTIDPTATCGDGASASAGAFVVSTSKDGKRFVKAAQGSFTAANLGRSNVVALKPGSGLGVRYVRLTVTSNQLPVGTKCPGPYAGCSYVDVTELGVHGSGA